MPKAAKIIIVVVGALAVVFCVGSFILDRSLLNQTYARVVAKGPALTLTDKDIAQKYPYEDVSFTIGDKTLRGHVYGGQNTQGLIVFRHGIFSQHQDYLAIITAMVDKGWKVFAYDAIGCGESDGDSVIGFAQSPLDVRAAVRYAVEQDLAKGAPIVLFGHSWGAYGVAGALDFPDVREAVSACVAMSGFDSPMKIIMESATSQMGAIALTQQPFLQLIGMLDFGSDADRSASKAISECGLPVLVMHGTEDSVIAYDGASIIAQRDAISNPQVSYITKSDPNRNGHNTYFYSPESQQYLAECAQAYEALQDEYDGDVPEEAFNEFRASIDLFRANTADPVLIDEADSFFREAIDENQQAGAL